MRQRYFLPAPTFGASSLMVVVWHLCASVNICARVKNPKQWPAIVLTHTNTAHTRSSLRDVMRLPKWLGHWKQSHKCSVTWKKTYCHHKKRNTEEAVSTAHILHRYQKLACNKDCCAECALQWWTKKVPLANGAIILPEQLCSVLVVSSEISTFPLRS